MSPPEAEGRQLISAYSEIKNVSYKGKKAAETQFTAKEKEIIEERRANGDGEGISTARTVYMRDRSRLGEIDISDYGRIYETGYINWGYGDNKDRPYEVGFATLSDDDLESREYAVDLSGLAKWAIAGYDAGKEDDFDLGAYRLIKIDNRNDLFIKEVTVIYNEEAPEDMEIKISGYVLERK